MPINIPSAEGPVNIGATLVVLVPKADGNQLSLTFYPDKNNDELRDANLPMRFYYIPKELGLASKIVDGQKQYAFHLQKFAGILTPDGNVGVPEDIELAGGYLVFSTSMEIDPALTEQIKAKLQTELEANYSSYRLMRWNHSLPKVMIAPVKITKAMTTIHKIEMGNFPTTTFGPPLGAFVVQGEGPANDESTGTDAYSVMLGQMPVQLVEAAAKSGTSNITVVKTIQYKMWAPVFKLVITANWSAIFEHLSFAFKARVWFASADVAAEFNNMERGGAIKVSLSIDPEYVNVDQEKLLDAQKSAIVDKFLEHAQKYIIEPADPKVEAAKAEEKGFWFWNVGAAFKFRKDRKTLTESYTEEKYYYAINNSNISSTLTGLAQEIKADPAREKLYFSEVFLDEGFKKIHVIASANVNWGITEKDGDPIDRIDVQIGYPDSKGSIVWKPTGKFKDGIAGDMSKSASPAFWDRTCQNRLYIFDFLRQNNLSADKQNTIFIKKNVRYKARPNVLVKTISSDTFSNERVVEVRGEPAGLFNVKISPNIPALPNRVRLTLTCRAAGVPDTLFEFNHKNAGDEANMPEFEWNIYYATLADIKPWQYKIDAVVVGPSILSKPLKWSTGFVDGVGKEISVDFPNATPEITAKLEDYWNAAMLV
jgi:hypothetical protein